MYRFDRDNIPDKDCIRMSEPERLPRDPPPARQTLYSWVTIGVRLRWMPGDARLKLPTFIRDGRKVTTLAAYKWWDDQQQVQP